MILRSCIYVHVSTKDARKAVQFAFKATENDAIQATRSVSLTYILDRKYVHS